MGFFKGVNIAMSARIAICYSVAEYPLSAPIEVGTGHV